MLESYREVERKVSVPRHDLARVRDADYAHHHQRHQHDPWGVDGIISSTGLGRRVENEGAGGKGREQGFVTRSSNGVDQLTQGAC